MSVKQYDIKSKWETEEERSETNRDGQSGEMESRKNIKQKESEGSSRILGTVEEIYNRTQQLEERREFRKYKGSNSGI